MHILLLRESIYNQTDVSYALAKHVICTHAKDANFVFSPLSLHVILGLIGAGSNGPTRDQLLGFLKSKSTEELNTLSSKVVTAVLAGGEALGGPRLSFANGVWVDRRVGLKHSFKQIAEKDYMAVSTNVDFQNKVCLLV